jgi:hypothetical protein
MIKNQALKSKIEFMQINPSMFVGRNTSFWQPLPFQTRSSSFAPSATPNQLGKGPSGSHFDPSSCVTFHFYLLAMIKRVFFFFLYWLPYEKNIIFLALFCAT